MNGIAKYRGFTLLELLIVLAIMVAIVGIAVPQFSRSMTSVHLRKSTQEISAILREARNSAISESRTVVLILDADKQLLQIQGSEFEYQWSDDVHVELAGTASSLFQEAIVLVRFYPDGTATNSALTISARERSHTIAVDWLTGRVSVS
jgi:general secretion pathway protein H